MKKKFLVATILLILPLHIYSAEKASVVPKESRVLGIIDYNSQSQNVITAPNSVKAGKEFEVKISTQGGGCEREGDTSVVLMQTGASITVFDFTTATQPGVACTMILKTFSHAVTLRFDQPGEMLLRVWGRAIGGDTPPDGAPVVVERKIKVE